MEVGNGTMMLDTRIAGFASVWCVEVSDFR